MKRFGINWIHLFGGFSLPTFIVFGDYIFPWTEKVINEPRIPGFWGDVVLFLCWFIMGIIMTYMYKKMDDDRKNNPQTKLTGKQLSFGFLLSAIIIFGLGSVPFVMSEEIRPKSIFWYVNGLILFWLVLGMGLSHCAKFLDRFHKN